MDHIKQVDLRLGTVERHQNEPISWHGKETVRENLATDNCGLRDYQVKVMTMHKPDGTPSGWCAPYVPNPLSLAEWEARPEDEKEEDEDGAEYDETLFLSKPYSAQSYKLFTPPAFLDFAEQCFKAANLDKTLAFTTTLFNGRRMTIAKHIPDADFETAHGDKVKSYFNLLNSFDGSWKVFGNVSEICTVCHNTATANIGKGGAGSKHRPDALAEFIRRFPDVFAAALKEHKTSANDYLRLADIPLSKAQAIAFFAALLGAGEELSKRSYNLANEELLALFKGGRGCHGESAADAYMAITDWRTHNFSAESNAPGGAADNSKRKAKEMLLSDKLPEFIARGEKLIAECMV